MLSKHVGAVKSVLKKWFEMNDIQLVHLLVVWYLVNLVQKCLVCSYIYIYIQYNKDICEGGGLASVLVVQYLGASDNLHVPAVLTCGRKPSL